MNRFDIQRRPSFSWRAAAPQHYAANHPLTYSEVRLILSDRSSLILAASDLIKGSSQVVDAQKLTASLNTDKSRFLTLCYALATILDVSRDLMQPHFDREFHPKNRTVLPPFDHVQVRSEAAEKLQSVYGRLSPAQTGKTSQKARFSLLFCVPTVAPARAALTSIPFFLRLRRKILDARHPARAALDFHRSLRLESMIVSLCWSVRGERWRP
jgi:hypothetical protein